MNNPTVRSTGTPSTALSSSVPAPIRLILAFRDAVKESIPESDLSEEALSVESLIIAGNAAFEALTRLDRFLNECVRGSKLSDAPDRRAVVVAYETWLDATEPLRQRMLSLMRESYESDSFTAFFGSMHLALANFSETWAREDLNRQALRTVELAALAAKLTPRQDVYDEEGAAG